MVVGQEIGSNHIKWDGLRHSPGVLHFQRSSQVFRTLLDSPGESQIEVTVGLVHLLIYSFIQSFYRDLCDGSFIHYVALVHYSSLRLAFS